MKKKDKIVNLFIIIFLVILVNNTTVYANPNSSKGFATYSDEQADAETNKLIQNQSKINKVTEVKSTNNYLKSLSVDGYKITPEFDKQIINYEIAEEITEDTITIKAETDSEKATVSGIGEIILNTGENNLSINVTAENGTVRTYYIKLTKTKKEVKLNSLKLIAVSNEKNIKTIELEPNFNSEIYTYNCNVENYIDRINIESIPNVENANIEIMGNENLKNGLNEILVTVKTEDTEKVIYKINVNKEEKRENIETKKDISKQGIICLIIIGIIGAIILIITVKKNKNSK